MNLCIRILILGLCACLPLSAFAARVAAERTDAGNTYFSGGEISIAEPVKADLFAAGGRVSVEQDVGADAALGGGSVDVKAAVGQDLRVAGGSLNIDNRVGGDLVAAGGTIKLAKSSDIVGSALMAGGEVDVAGKIEQGAKIYAGKINISGEVRGDTRLYGREIALSPEARIVGDLFYASPTPLPQEQLAQVSGKVVRERTPDSWSHAPAGTARGTALFHPIFFLSMLACGSLLFLLFPNAVGGAQQAIRQYPLRSLVTGLALLFTVPPVAILFIVTLIGLPIGLGLLALYPLLLLLGYLGAAFFIGRQAADALKQPREFSRWRQFSFLAAALLLLSVVAMIPLLGGFLVFLALVTGIGGWAVWLYKRYRSEGVPGAAAGTGVQA